MERERLLLKLADGIERHADELAALETLNQGKTLGLARAVDVGAGGRSRHHCAVQRISVLPGAASNSKSVTTDRSRLSHIAQGHWPTYSQSP